MNGYGIFIGTNRNKGALAFIQATDTGQVELVWSQLLELGQDRLQVAIQTRPFSQRGPIPETVSVPLDALEDWHVMLPDGSIRGSFTTQAEIAIRKRAGGKLPRHIAALEGRFVDS